MFSDPNPPEPPVAAAREESGGCIMVTFMHVPAGMTAANPIVVLGSQSS
jgi:hypothetical protein